MNHSVVVNMRIVILLIIFFIKSNFVYSANIDTYATTDKPIVNSIYSKFNANVDVEEENNQFGIKIKAKKWIAYDAISHQILDGNNIYERVPLSYFTRLMLIHMLLNEITSNKINLNDGIKISKETQDFILKEIKRTKHKTMFNLKQNIYIKDIIVASLINNSAEASLLMQYVLQKSTGLNNKNLIASMNQEAQRLGLLYTKFNNILGEEDASHYTNAHNLAKMMYVFMQEHNAYKNLFGQKEFNYQKINYKNIYPIVWTDKDIYMSIDSQLNNQTSFIASKEIVEKNTGINLRKVIVVLLDIENTEDTTSETLKLMNYALTDFEMLKGYSANSVIGDYKVWMAKKNTVRLGVKQDIFMTIPKGKQAELSTVLDKPKYIYAPVQEGNQIANIQWLYNKKVVYQVPVVALENIEEAGFIQKWIDKIKMMFSS